MKKTLYISDIDGNEKFQNITLDVKEYLPKAFGYSIELSANVNILSIAGAYGKAGLNYVVFTKGVYSWFPFEYVYAGYSLNFVVLTGDLKDTIKNLLNVKKAKDLLKLAGGGVGAGVSPFAAWLNSNEVTPSSWTGWFVANTLSVKARAGLGINFGGSVFAGTYADWGWEPLNFDFEKARRNKVWYGGTIDVGVAGGTPAIEVGLHYASKFWLMDEDRVHSWRKDGLAFGIRWYQFLKLKPDSIQFYEKILGIKFPQWLKDVINISNSFAVNNDIKSVDDYNLHANRDILDNEYKLALATKGYNAEFFASLNNNSNNDLA